MEETVVIEGKSRKYPSYLAEAYKLRYQVFCLNKEWVSPNQERLEIDAYDHLSPVYFVHLNDAGEVDGCCRILPTTGPTMLNDIFFELLGEHTMPQAQNVWEVSRFAVDTPLGSHSFASTSYVMSSLLISMFKYALNKDIKQIVAVTDTAFERALRRGGLYTTRFSVPRKYDNCEAVAGYAEVNSDIIAMLEERSTKNSKRRFAKYEEETVYANQVEILPPQNSDQAPPHCVRI